MGIRTIVCVSLALIGAGNFAFAQTTLPTDPRLEVFGGIGWGRLFRVEDRTFGDRPNIAVGFGVDLVPRVHVEFEQWTPSGSP